MQFRVFPEVIISGLVFLRHCITFQHKAGDKAPADFSAVEFLEDSVWNKSPVGQIQDFWDQIEFSRIQHLRDLVQLYNFYRRDSLKQTICTILKRTLIGTLCENRLRR